MDYDASLAARLSEQLQSYTGISEKRMMGGICFFLNGNMLCGADQSRDGQRRFMFRVGKEQEVEALARNGASPVEFSGRKMGGMVFVDEAACNAAAIRDWIDLSMQFVSQFEPK